jgi:hypothetical protein
MKTFSGIGMLTSEIGHFVEFLDLFPAADQPLVMGEALWGQPPGARLWPCHWSGVLKGHDFGGCGKTGRAGEKLTAGAKARMYFGDLARINSCPSQNVPRLSFSAASSVVPIRL